jgi:hypothetical protein
VWENDALASRGVVVAFYCSEKHEVSGDLIMC